MVTDEEKIIRVNLKIDKEINPEIYKKIKKISKRKRAGVIRRLLEDSIKK